MGVPALFRWLSQKYPKIISPVVEELPREIDGIEIPVDTSTPNPNGEEMDNLYLDMNGIVHPCSHPEDRPPPANEEEMMLEIFKYTDRVVNMVRPRKLLMIAVDGVAPRAKMNQQRSRRFRSAQEAKEKDDDYAEFVKMLKSKAGGALAEGAEEVMNKKTWDSNAITPGTPFMDILAASLRYWAAYKLNTDPAWAKDADLIMLGLATHEPHFRVLREDVFFQDSKPRTCRICGQTGHKAEECRGEAKVKDGEYDEKDRAHPLKPFIWLHVSILREYLQAELYVPSQPFRFDLERALDDWVFMCFFVGNDFLPHLPSLDIRENGIDTLIAIWRDNIPIMGGYVTKDGQVDLAKAQVILDGLAAQEDAIFQRRRQADEKKEKNAKRRKLEQERYPSRSSLGIHDASNYNLPTLAQGRRARNEDLHAPAESLPLFAPDNITKEALALTHDMVFNRGAIYRADQANKSAAAALKSRLRDAGSTTSPTADGAPEKDGSGESESNRASAEVGQSGKSKKTTTEAACEPQPSPQALGKRKAELLDEDTSSTPGRNTPNVPQPAARQDDSTADTVRLWEEGYADRYYEQKFGVDPQDIEFRRKVSRAYVEGLAWVLLYYFQGCPSWTWYYPYHYAPFAADFSDLESVEIRFEKGTPFKPFEQLMGVLPAASRHAIPQVFQSLMTEEDSEIIDFYPEDFPIDMNGKKFAWQGVALLPFIDEKRLLQAMSEKYPLLSSEDAARNQVGKDVLFVSDGHPLYDEVAANFYSKKQSAPKYKLRARISEGLAGKVGKIETQLPRSSLVSPLKDNQMPDLDSDRSICVHYDMPRRAGQVEPVEVTEEHRFEQTLHLDEGEVVGWEPTATSALPHIRYLPGLNLLIPASPTWHPAHQGASMAVDVTECTRLSVQCGWKPRFAYRYEADAR
ncbi:MAG: 5'-3' exoribonuclease 2 [Phylliscum demangeonii]|nr:MAG: 5'-3' exoribonuclease 2 [Phylliscum demangeonii]